MSDETGVAKNAVEHESLRQLDRLFRWTQHETRCGVHTTISQECSCGLEDSIRITLDERRQLRADLEAAREQVRAIEAVRQGQLGVQLSEQMRLMTDLEAARAEISALGTALNNARRQLERAEGHAEYRHRLLIEKQEMSRATEAELRARVEKLKGALIAEHQRSNGSSAYMNPPMHERSIRRCKHPLCLALDAQEPRT